MPAHAANSRGGFCAEQTAVRDPPQSAPLDDPPRSFHSFINVIEFGVASGRARDTVLSGKLYIGKRQHSTRIAIQRLDQTCYVIGHRRVVMRSKEKMISFRLSKQRVDVANPSLALRL